MAELNILEFLGLDRAKPIHSDSKKLLDSEVSILNEVKEKDFGIDLVYFNTDEETKNSFPSIFLKKVSDFNDVKILKDIAETQRKIWNYKKVMFLYAYSELEIRIYNCSEKPLIITEKNFSYEKELKSIEIQSYRYSDKQQLQELNKLFSRIAIDTGIIWTLEEAQFVRDKISLQRRVDKYLVESLINTSKQLENDGLEINLIHKIILRSLFLLYLEDRGATDEKLYSLYKKDANSYFDILDDVEATYKLYERLEDDFNGNIFTLEQTETIKTEHLQIIKKCFISGNDNTPQIKLFEDWRLFNFSIIQIELLSEIYENFLFKTDPELKKQTGTYYTPPSLVEFILNEKLPTNNKEKNYNVKVLDPSCGSGIFLVESFKRLVKRYENHNNEKLNNFDKLKKLLTDNIYGIELNPQAIKVAAFSLYLALVDNLDPKTLWQSKKHSLPNLINNPNDQAIKEQGKNLFCRDTISDISDINELQNFDLIVGNPPFGELISEEKDIEGKHKNIRNYCNQYNFAKEMVLPFLHKATQFSPNGKIALIFNTKVLTNTGGTYQNFRKWLFNDCYVDKVFNFSILRNAKKNFGGQLFGDATGPISIIYYQKGEPQNYSDKIAYYAPKTYIKSNVIEGLSIDFTDLKYLPREECKKPDTKIWKVAMWGSISDWELIERLNNSNLSTIGKFNENKNIKSGVGFGLLTNSVDKPLYSEVLSNIKYLDANVITRYYTPNDSLSDVKTSIKTSKAVNFYKKFYNVSDIDKIERLTAFRRLGDIDAFINPHIVIKKGLEKNRICASFIDIPCSFKDGVYGFYSDGQQTDELYLLMSYFNSKLSSYYLFMTISSYGIEREQVMKNEYLSIPISLSEEYFKLLVNSSKYIIDKLKSKSFLNDLFANNELESYIYENIDKVIYESLNLNESEKALVNDSINYSLDLFHKQEKSIALYPTNKAHVMDYCNIINREINDFLYGQELYASLTVYNINRFTPLMMVKLTFDKKEKKIATSKEFIDIELKNLDQYLWEEKSSSIYFRKKMNYKKGNDIYIIRPNQRRFWSSSMALEDANELILEILNGN
ncbi:HsdM family class I SAM-dependent methyltransferase [Chryseobacterium sp. CP-77]|uniref:HsdM family class I SAM-dependent methyltransferase n=1 Tax=Chryseobacterium sp. CP-77 TaxID=3116594 RepID=UPI002ED56165